MEDRVGIERGDMNKFPRGVQDLVLHLVNTEGIRWRQATSNHLLLYPPDGVGRPFKISASRPAEMQNTFIERQFMAVYGVKDAQGHVPGAKEEVEEMTISAPQTTKGIWGPESEPAEAVRTLAAALGVSLGGTVSEDDYLVAVAEKDALHEEVERLATDLGLARNEIEMLAETVADLTKHRDQLLGEHTDMARRVEAARQALEL